MKNLRMRRPVGLVPDDKTAGAASPAARALPIAPSVWPALGPILALGYCLRVYRLGFGQAFHPDERHTLDVASQISWHNANPHSFAYGSFPYYTLAFFHGLCRLLGLGENGIELQGRLLSTLIGTLGIYLTFRLAERVTGRRATATLAAALLAVTFFHVQNCHFFTVDIWLTTLCSVALIGVIRYLENGSRRAGILTAAAMGLALATKISAIVLLVPLGAAVLVRIRDGAQRRASRELQLAAGIVLAALAVGLAAEPYALLDWPRFTANMSEQIRMANGHAIRPFTLQYVHTAAWGYPLVQMIRHGMGWPLGAAAWVGVALALRRQWRAIRGPELVVLVWTLAFFATLGAQHTKFPRYLLPIYPTLALFAAQALEDLSRAIRAALGRLPSGRFPEWWALAPTAFVLGSAFVYTVSYLGIYAQPHTWRTASAWMFRTFPRNPQGWRLLGESWDDLLPVGVEGYTEPNYTRLVPLPIYDLEDPQHLDEFAHALADADLMPLATARGYGAILSAPELHPITARYYRLLFGNRLGYRILRTFKYEIAFGPIAFPDDLADESFSVYTDPKVVIFRNTDRLSAMELLRRIQENVDMATLPTRDQIMTVKVD
jgi:4-amino-4-deoxy-L-arabinose transferase-like glycosyltransferase